MYKAKILKRCCDRFISPQRCFRTRSSSDGANLNVNLEKHLHTKNAGLETKPTKATLRRPPSPTGAGTQKRHGGHAAPVAMAKLASEPFLTGTSSIYIEEMYFAWLDNPDAVHKVYCI